MDLLQRCSKVFFVIILAVTGIAAAWFYLSQQIHLLKETTNELTTIVRLKSNQVAEWRRERILTARLIAENPLFAGAISRFVKQSDDDSGNEILSFFQTLQERYHYADVILANPAGEVLLSLRAPAGQLDESALQELSRTLRERQPVLTDIHVGELIEEPHIGVITPIEDSFGQSQPPIAALVLICGARQFLYPLIESLKTYSETAETYLVRPDRDQVLFLSPLRHQADAALDLRFPLSRKEAPSVQAALGHRGAFQGIDYRGIPVISVIESVPDSSWKIVTKIDTGEALAEFHLRFFLLLSILLGIAALAGGLFLVAWQRTQKRHYQNLFQTEAALRSSQDRASMILTSMEEAIIALNAKGQIELMNPVAEALTGWNQEEALGKPLEDVFQIFDERTELQEIHATAEADSKSRTPRPGRYPLLTARDGTIRSISKRIVPIRDEQETDTGSVLIFRDCTAESEAWKRLEEERNKSQQYLDVSGVMLLTLDRSGTITMINHRGCEILCGEEKDFLGCNWIEHFIPARQRDGIRKVFAEIVAGTTDVHRYATNSILTRQGEERIMAWHNTLLRDDQGAIAGTLSSGEDITERKRAEDALKAAYIKLETLWSISSLEDADARVIADHILESLTRMSRSEYGFYGVINDDESLMTIHSWSAEAMKDCSMREIPRVFPVHEGGLWAEAIRQRKPVILNDYAAWHQAKKGLPEGHVPLTNLLVVPFFSHGRITALAAVANRMADYDQEDVNHITAFMTSIQAITESKRSEEALRESERNLAAILQASPESAFLIDLTGIVIQCNLISARRLSLRPEEMIGRNVFDFLPPELASVRRQFVKQVIQSGEPVHFEDTRDGLFFSHYLYPVFDNSGKVSRVAIFGHDITKYRQALAEIHQQRDLLAAIREVQDLFISGHDPRQVYQEMLHILVQSTGSAYGFLDEVFYDPDGTAYKLSLALSDISWDDQSRAVYQQLVDQKLEFRNLKNLAGAPVLERRLIIANDVPKDSRYRGIPHGHPHLSSYMGVPLYYGNELIGVAGVANCPAGYSEKIAERIKPLTQACAAMIWAGRMAQREEENLRALEASEEKYRRIAETANEGIWAMDEKYCATYVNQHMADMLGYTPEQMLGKRVDSFMFPDDLGDHTSQMTARRAGQGGSYERRFQHKNGSAVWTIVSATPLKNEQGQFAGSFAMFTNITERKRAEEALRESKERFEQAMKATHDGLFDWNLQTREIYYSPAWKSMLGYREDEIENRFSEWERLTDPRDVQESQTMLKEHLEGKRERFEKEYKMRHKDGYWVDILSRANAIYNDQGKAVRVVGTHVDLSEIRRAETEQKRLIAAIEQTGETIVITDPQGTIQYVNPAFERITGYRREEAIGQNPRILKSGKQDQTFYETMWETLSAGKTWEGRMINKRKDGTLYTEDATISPVLDSAGAIVNYVAVKRDVTRELELEEQYRQSQKMESVGRLAGGVAHDFNNMLSVILGHSELALEAIAPTDALYASLKEIQKAAERSSGLTRQLLAFARRQTAIPRVLNLNDTLEGMLKMLRRLIGEEIDLIWKPQAELWPIRMDPSQTDQILANLCVNARDAIAGAGRIEIETQNTTLDEAYCDGHAEVVSGCYVLLIVSDNGAGMDEYVLQHLFEPFFTTKSTGRGTGLGLPTVYGIVRQNNGFLSVYSEPGHGTTFKIYLPRYVGQAEDQETPTLPDSPQGQGESVLLVEDEPGILELGKSMLERLGYRVLSAENPNEAIRLAESYSGAIHLLITDVVMPVMNGRELEERIRLIKPDLRCLFMSGYTADVIARRGVLNEGVHFIQKPFSVGALARKVREVLIS